MTSEEAFTGVKLEVDHLRIFGCLAYINVPKDKRTKLEPLGKKGTFVGYTESSTACRIYIPGSGQIEVSRDVTFEEDMGLRKGRGFDMEINDDEEMISSLPPIVQRDFEENNEPFDLIDPVAPVDAPTYMAIYWNIFPI